MVAFIFTFVMLSTQIKPIYSWLVGSVATTLSFPARSKNPLQPRLEAYREATFGMGCFWEPSESLLQVEGVMDTVVGYAGGSLSGVRKPMKNPTYDDVCYGDVWVEAVRVLYDDQVVSFETLLDRFLELQNPIIGTRQYDSVIFPHDEIQNETAEHWKQQAAPPSQQSNKAVLPKSVVSIECYDNDYSFLFYQAEDYHQEYWQKWRPRIAGGVVLLSIASGLLAPILSPEQESQIKTCCTSLFLLGSLYYGILERSFFASRTRELVPGSLANKIR
mmetsp:Transcript_31984/g.48658  ORF Transcript_31984/g.48658 Transcript_31984/m.48658 type:complete len:275 (-) Transcript_31984:81-905(-)